MNWMRNLVLLINNYWKQQTDNNKTLILFFYWLKSVTPCSKFCINITHLNESEALITVMSGLFFCEGFSLGHVIITTIIRWTGTHANHEKMWCRTSTNCRVAHWQNLKPVQLEVRPTEKKQVLALVHYKYMDCTYLMWKRAYRIRGKWTFVSWHFSDLQIYICECADQYCCQFELRGVKKVWCRSAYVIYRIGLWFIQFQAVAII